MKKLLAIILALKSVSYFVAEICLLLQFLSDFGIFMPVFS